MATPPSHLPTNIRSLYQPSADSKKVTLTTLPTPHVDPSSKTEHLIRVHTVALCNGELLWSAAHPRPDYATNPLVPGFDIAGEVITSPSDSPFPPGTEIYGRTSFFRTGSAREYTIAETEELALRPQRLSWVESSAVPLSALTAWQALFVHAGLGGIGDERAKGKRVMVTAASGGVGAWAVQLAREAGAVVVGTCGTGNVDLVRGLGAEDVLDYRKVDLKAWGEKEVNKVDVVIDCIGRTALEGGWWAVKDGGFLISVYGPPKDSKPKGYEGKGVKDEYFIMHPERLQLQAITDLVNAGKCHPIVDSVWRFEEYEKAFERADGDHAVGKVVLDLMAKD